MYYLTDSFLRDPDIPISAKNTLRQILKHISVQQQPVCEYEDWNGFVPQRSRRVHQSSCSCSCSCWRRRRRRKEEEWIAAKWPKTRVLCLSTNTQCPGQEESENNTSDDTVSYPINQQDVPTPCKQGSFPNEERGTAEKQTRDDLHIRSGQTDHKQGDWMSNER